MFVSGGFGRARCSCHSPFPRSRPGGLRRSDGGDRRRVTRKIHFLAFDLPHSDACFVEGLSGGDDRGVLRWPQRGGCLLRRRPPIHPVRQHQAGGCPDPGRWEAAANARLHGTSIPLSVRGQVRPAGQGQRQRQGRGTGRLHPAELPGPRPAAESFEALNDALADSAAGARRRGCGATRRPSASVSSGIVKFSCHCRLLPMMPAISALDG